MVKAEVIDIPNEEENTTEYDVKVFGSDSDMTESALIYCKDRTTALELSEELNKLFGYFKGRIDE